jgi:pimeloyl-ACP methyl ester carboxylesterase
LTEHIDIQWEHPLMAQFLERLASFSRLIMFDRRGAGAADPVPRDGLPTWEEWAHDLRTVLDAVGSNRAAIYAELDAGPVGMIFAATHPERTSALILGNSAARYTQADDYSEGNHVGNRAIRRADIPQHGERSFLFALAGQVHAGIGHPPNGNRPVSLHLRVGCAFSADQNRRANPGPAPIRLLPGPIKQGRYLADHIPGGKFLRSPDAMPGSLPRAPVRFWTTWPSS